MTGPPGWGLAGSVAAEQVAGVHLVGHVVQLVDEPVGDDDVAAPLELVEVAHHLGAVEPVVLELGLVDDDAAPRVGRGVRS